VNNIETGRVEKGEKSKQKFTEVDMEFEKHYLLLFRFYLKVENQQK
jgi:hypothetical protein